MSQWPPDRKLTDCRTAAGAYGSSTGRKYGYVGEGVHEGRVKYTYEAATFGWNSHLSVIGAGIGQPDGRHTVWLEYGPVGEIVHEGYQQQRKLPEAPISQPRPKGCKHPQTR
jgi:hypothetical protein